MTLALVPLVLPQRLSGVAWRNNTNALHQKSLKGWSPEKMLPLALGKS